jgi:hypothetical protein
MQTTFRKYGRHSLKGLQLDDGRFFPDYQDATRILMSILEVPVEVIESMPKLKSPLDASLGFQTVLDATADDPASIDYRNWLAGLVRANEGYDGATLVNIFRHFGKKVTRGEVFQCLLESPDTVVVADCNGTRIYDKAGRLLAEC